MRGDSCTAEQKVQDGPQTSITFGMEVKPPDLPCREDVLVQGGDAAPRSCVPSLEMRSPTAAGGLVPTDEASTATETTSNEPLLRFYAAEEMNPEDDSKEKIHGLQLHPPRTTAAASGDYCLLPHTATRSLRLNPGKMELLIQAVHEATSASAHFWGLWRALVCGEVVRAGVAGDELQRFFGGDLLAL